MIGEEDKQILKQINIIEFIKEVEYVYTDENNLRKAIEVVKQFIKKQLQEVRDEIIDEPYAELPRDVKAKIEEVFEERGIK